MAGLETYLKLRHPSTQGGLFARNADLFLQQFHAANSSFIIEAISKTPLRFARALLSKHSLMSGVPETRNEIPNS
jgi:hypothetical protein